MASASATASTDTPSRCFLDFGVGFLCMRKLLINIFVFDQFPVL